ncbi:MAG: 4Fe-4S binding protein [Candidatus Humimicrobiaceae bacterium]
MDLVWIILILSGIGLVSGILIFIVNRMLPKESESLKKTEDIEKRLPGYNCGACGYPGCFAYAQALAEDKDLIITSPCTTVLQNEEMLSNIEKVLGMEIDTSEMNKKAVVCCYGVTKPLGDYNGIDSCEAANNLLGGFKKCPYGCLGLGDCMKVCPQDAIEIDKERNVAVIDPDKCTGCGLCVKECPKNIIELVPADANIVYRCSYEPIKNIPGREKCDEGCIHCRKCFKACENDAIIWNDEKNIPEFDFSKCTLCGECIEACPHNRLIEFSELSHKEKGKKAEEKVVNSKK